MTFPLLFMSLADVHEPRGLLQTGGCTLRRDPDPPQGLEQDLNRFAQALAFTTLQDADGTVHVWYSLRRSPEPFLVEHLSPAQASARSHSESAKTFSLTRPGWDPAKMKWQVCYARTRDGVHDGGHHGLQEKPVGLEETVGPKPVLDAADARARVAALP